MEYKDFVAILLTAITVIISLVGIGLAVAAIFGWKAMKEGAAREAAKSATATINDHLASREFHEKLQTLVESEVKEQTLERFSKAYDEMRKGGKDGNRDDDKPVFRG